MQDAAKLLLTPEQLQFFHDNGELRANAWPLRAFDHAQDTFTSFTTEAQKVQVSMVCGFAAGYLVLEDFASQDEVAKLKERAEQIIEEYDASNPSVFSTVNQVHQRQQ